MLGKRPNLKDKQRPAKKLKIEDVPRPKPLLKSALKKPTTSQTKPEAPKPAPKLSSKPTLKPAIKPATKPALKATQRQPPPPPKAQSKLGKVSLKELKDKKGKAKATEPHDGPARLPSTFKVMAGSYEKLLYGLEGTVTVEGSSHQFHLKPIFMFPAHVSSLKAVAASPQGGKWLATGSSDEIIKVWDLRRRKEVGGLMHHEGSITHLEFPSRSHLLSASEDGSLCIFRARDWTVLRALKGHKGRVNCVASHPSGKVALSVGKDRTLRMWDLMRGKGSASTKLGKEAELVRWSTDGSLFVVQTMSTLDFYDTNMVLIHTLQHPSRVHDVRFCKRDDGAGELLLVAAEDKKVAVYDVPTDREQPPTVIAYFLGHENRVKAVGNLTIALPSAPGSTRTSMTVVSTISSDGKIRLFDLGGITSSASSKDPAQIQPLTEYDTKGSRLTCMTIADGESAAPASAVVNGKRKRTDDEEDEDKIDESAGEWASQQNPGGEIDDEEDASEEGESEAENEEEDEEEEEDEQEDEEEDEQEIDED